MGVVSMLEIQPWLKNSLHYIASKNQPKVLHRKALLKGHITSSMTSKSMRIAV